LRELALRQELQTVYSSAVTEPAISVLSHFWAPLCAVGSHGPNGPNAQICVSVFGASIVPERPRLLVVLSNTNYTTGLVARAGTLSVSVLAESQAGLLDPLGLKTGRDGPKLDGIEHELTLAGDPIFPGGAGWAYGEVLQDQDFGDSTGFLVAVREKSDGAMAPLSWQTAKGIVGAEFLTRWAEKSAREQKAARQAMAWRD
jgi:flavin reductase (DIM6/NTAB) family NADH-FMN oxidoreductase RutF